MSWRQQQIDIIRSKGPPMDLHRFHCEKCGGGEFVLFGYGPAKQLHLYCNSCDEVLCFHEARCAAEQQTWVLVDPTSADDSPADAPWNGGV